MLITAIKQQSKNDNRVSIFVDDEYSFSLNQSQLLQSKIAVGDSISVSEITEYKKLSDIGKLQDRAIDWAMRRHHSKKEITKYLQRKTQDDDTINFLLNALKKLGFVDDFRFTSSWAESRKRKGYSNFVIRGELIKKGISEEIISQVLESNSSDIDALKMLIDKKKNKASYQDKNKFMAYLSSKGFRYEDIKKALENL